MLPSQTLPYGHPSSAVPTCFLRLKTVTKRHRRKRWSSSRCSSHPPGLAADVSRPSLHEATSALEQVRACVSRFGFILDDVRQSLLGYVPRLARLPAPVPETGPEPVGHRPNRVIPAELGQRGVRQWFSPQRWKDKLAPRRKLLRFPKHLQRTA